MKKQDEMKKKQFPIGIFFAFLGVLMLMSAIHIGAILFMEERNWNHIFQFLFPVFYWGLVAGVLVWITRKQIRVAINRMELIRLERKFEACVKEVEKLEHSKTLRANIYALGIGIVGTGFLMVAWHI